MGKIKATSHQTKNGNTVLIRSVAESDAEEFLKLGKAVMSENIYSMTQADELNFTLEQERAWIKSHIDNPNHLVLAAETEGKIVGQLDFSNGPKRRIAHTGEFGMGVHKDFRELGIGNLLLMKLIEWAKSNDTIEKINLCVHHTNDRAIAMYEKHGFQREGLRTKDLKYSNSEYVDTVLMGLHL